MKTSVCQSKCHEKKITLCEDETFHPEICLVAIEAMSNFIILEKYVTNRDGATWNKAIEEALCDLPVDVMQNSSDEGKGLLNHVQKGLKVHHSPDTFHVSYEISKGMNGALCSEVKHSEKEYEAAQKRTQEERERMDKNQVKRPVGRRPAFEKKIANAELAEQQAEEKLYQAQQNQELVRTAKAEIGYVYHPYSLQTGEKQDANTVSERLEECFNHLNEVAICLSERCQKHIKKAHRVVETMKSTIAFFFHTINLYVESMNISIEEQKVMHKYIIPGFYLQEVARKDNDPQRKKIISEKSKELLSILYEKDGPFGCCNEEKRRHFEAVGRECAGIFQRSSSCVEGRNAQLSLHHHGLHRLDNHKLQALTAVHNYYVKRKDGTTAAERFFESKPNDMFQWLIDHVALPARPRGQRKAA